MAGYTPGTCNIDDSEARRRKIAGVLSLGTGVLFSFTYIWLSSPPYMIMFVFIALTTGVIGIMQGRKNFCVAFAKAGKKKIADDTELVAEAVDMQKDSAAANVLILKAVAVGLVASMVVYGLGIYL